MKLGNGGSRGGLVIALCIALAGAGAAAFAACAKGEEDGEGAPVAPGAPDSSASDPDVKRPAIADTAAPYSDAGSSDPDADADPGTPDTSAPDTSAPDVNVPDTSVPKDAGHDVAVEAAADSGSSCGGLAEWSAGTTATHVKHSGEKYTCIVPGWCQDAASTSVAAYEPGKGWAWSQAWNDDGPCP